MLGQPNKGLTYMRTLLIKVWHHQKEGSMVIWLDLSSDAFKYVQVQELAVTIVAKLGQPAVAVCVSSCL